METDKKIALVTGANRGIGFETCRRLAQHNMRVIMTSRHEEKGKKAAQRLIEAGLDITYHPLDVADDDSVATAKAFVFETFGHLDVLINNAGVFLDGVPGIRFDSVFDTPIQILRDSMEINLYGALRMCQAFIPAMRERGYGRVVNLSSGMGQLTEMNGCCPGYRTSKAALNALTRICNDELQGSNVLINSLCPGWVRTDMGGPNATRSIEDGTDTIVWLATLPDGGPSGGFYRDREPIPW